jgi:hypothetical protein
VDDPARGSGQASSAIVEWNEKGRASGAAQQIFKMEKIYFMSPFFM